MRLSLIIPTYDERANIKPLVERVERALAGTAHELIFVDDSTDGTDAEIVILSRRYPNIRLVHRANRSGLATAVIEGLEHANGDVICVLDADLQHPPETIQLLLKSFDATGADVVVASRRVPGGDYGSFSVARRLASRLATMIAHALLTRARLVSDPMSGFFLVRAGALKGVVLRPVGYKILLEILVRGHVQRVAEVPYCFQSREAGTSKLTVRQQREYLIHLLRLVSAQPAGLRFVRFCVVGGSGVLINMGMLWLLTTRGVHYFVSGVAGVAVATTSNFLLNDLFTWRDRRSNSWRIKAGRYVRYWVATGLSSAVQLFLLFLLTSIGFPFLLSNLVGIGAAAVLNFRLNNRWTWKPPQSPIQHGVGGRALGDIREHAGLGRRLAAQLLQRYPPCD